MIWQQNFVQIKLWKKNQSSRKVAKDHSNYFGFQSPPPLNHKLMDDPVAASFISTSKRKGVTTGCTKSFGLLYCQCTTWIYCIGSSGGG